MTGRNSFSFSNTMEWDPRLLALSEEKTHYNIDWEKVINLSPPSKNSSPETKRELETLVEYKSLRTQEELEQINKEIDLKTTELGGRPAPDYFDENKFPATAELFRYSFSDLNILIMSEKKIFDRVRPNILEPDIEPVIKVPGHPAYPSGHSTQAHFLAFVLGELMPDRRDALIARAGEIAKNREIAGLHYPSDSRAGATLARQFVDLLLKNAEFQALLKTARQEWR